MGFAPWCCLKGRVCLKSRPSLQKRFVYCTLIIAQRFEKKIHEEKKVLLNIEGKKRNRCQDKSVSIRDELNAEVVHRL